MLSPSRAAVVAALGAGLALCATPCGANGMFAVKGLDLHDSGTSAAQVGIVLRDGPHELLLLRTTYRGPAKDFAWVVPVPRQPEGPGGVFTASSFDMDNELEYTRPEKHLDMPPTPSPMLFSLACSAKNDGEDASGSVRVLSRTAVGDYDVSVLAARDSSALAEWLRRNRYPLPDAARPIIASYIERGWVFVAMRVLDWVQARRPVMDAVTPIGIRFQAETLMFPLEISRVSAPAWTSLLLLVYDAAPVRCLEFPVRHIGRKVSLRAGDSYEQYRERLSSDDGTGLVCEGLIPSEASELGFLASAPRNGRPPGVHASPDLAGTGFLATRLWGRIEREQLVDLTFVPDREARRPYRVRVDLRVPKSTLARAQLGRLSLLESIAIRDWSGVQWVSLLLAVIAWAGLRRRGCLARAAILAGLAFVLLFPTVWSPEGLPGARERCLDALNERQEAIRSAVDRFVGDAGAYPAALSDLACKKAVETGLDASGNPVRLRRPLPGTYLPSLPVDPLTGHSDTWTYWVRGEPTIQSGGFRTEVRRGKSRPSRDARSSRRRTRHRTSFDVSHAVAWAVPESANAGVRVTRLAGEGPCWLPVTSLAPEGGWDYRHYRRARKWIEHFAGDSEVPVLPL